MRLNRRIKIGTTVKINGYRCLVLTINPTRTHFKAAPIEPTGNLAGFELWWRNAKQIESFRNEFKSWLDKRL